MQIKESTTVYDAIVVGLHGCGESMALKDNYCEINPMIVDEWGIPVLRFHYKWSDNERNQAKHMQDSFEEIQTNMGGEVVGGKAGKERDYGLLHLEDRDRGAGLQGEHAHCMERCAGTARGVLRPRMAGQVRGPGQA